jgi:predicted nucleic acid-binding protein
MNGNRYVLDTNAIVALLQGNLQLIELLKNADWVGISVISQIEFLVFPSLSQADRQIFERFIQRVEVIGLSVDDLVLIEKIIVIRQQYRLKLPDAIIAAITIENLASLVTADREFIKVRALTLINFN